MVSLLVVLYLLAALNVPLVRERILVSDVSLTCEYPNLLMQRRPA